MANTDLPDDVWQEAEIKRYDTACQARIREALRGYVQPADLEAAVQAIMPFSRDFAGSFHLVCDRVRIRRKRRPDS